MSLLLPFARRQVRMSSSITASASTGGAGAVTVYCLRRIGCRRKCKSRWQLLPRNHNNNNSNNHNGFNKLSFSKFTTTTSTIIDANHDSNERMTMNVQCWNSMLNVAAGTESIVSDPTSLHYQKTKASILCDIGFMYHQGTVPDTNTTTTTKNNASYSSFLPPDLLKAQAMYEQSVALKYAPAASLLVDLYFYNNTDVRANAALDVETDSSPESSSESFSSKNDNDDDTTRCIRWCNTALELTDPDIPDDAYMRCRVYQKLGILHYRRNQQQQKQLMDTNPPTRNNDDDGIAQSSLLLSSDKYFNYALDVCHRHLGGNFAFLLSHDPPGLFPLLQKEFDEVNDIPLLQQNLHGFQKDTSSLDGVVAKKKNHNSDDGNSNARNDTYSDESGGSSSSISMSNLVALRNYTKQLRQMERNDRSFALSLQQNCLELFPTNNHDGGGSWGVTYLSSFFKVMGNPLLQQSMNKHNNNKSSSSSSSFQMIVLGSALGNACVWPILAFGFTSCYGFDIMDTCIEKSKELIVAVPGPGGALVQERAQFHKLDVVNNIDLVQQFISAGKGDGSDDAENHNNKMTIVWSNDYTWGTQSQTHIETKMFDVLKSGDALILYRPPHTFGDGLDIDDNSNTKCKWSRGGKINHIPLSWNTNSTMYILIK